MASRASKQLKEEPEELESEEAEESPDQEEALAPGEAEDEPDSGVQRTAKARAPRQPAVAPVKRPRPVRRGARTRRDPRQLSLFSRLAPERISQNVTKTGGSILISLLAIGVLILLFHLFAGSRFFALKSVDVKGNSLLSAEEVEVMVKSVVSRGVLNADLDQIRAKLESYPLIREAEVARLLPDRLRVTIVERQPVALARRGESIVCVDDEGVMFGDISHWRGKITPPVITGLVQGGENASEANRQRIMTYKRLMAELDQSEPPLSSRIDAIHFDEDRDVILTLADSHVTVRIGKEDFRARLNAALDVLDAVRRKDAEALNVLRISDAERLLGGTRIAYLNATDPKRVIVGLDE
jgi:cell division protein FtsQ